MSNPFVDHNWRYCLAKRNHMKNHKTVSMKEMVRPTTPTTPKVKIDMDELAKLWIEIVLQQIQNSQSFSLKQVHTINI